MVVRSSVASIVGGVLLLACGGSDPGTSGGSSTGAGATSSTGTGTGPGVTTGSSGAEVPTTSGATGEASTSAPTSTSIDPTTGQATTTSPIDPTTGAATSTTGVDPSTTSTGGEPDTSSSSSSSGSSGGDGEAPPPPGMLEGCPGGACECCEPWPLSWAPVPGATHYQVRWKCSINPEQVHDLGTATMVADVCNDIEMCNGMCAFTVGYIKVEACNDDGCSPAVSFPELEVPITCGGGCCC